jgi:hypothetical protein
MHEPPSFSKGNSISELLKRLAHMTDHSISQNFSTSESSQSEVPDNIPAWKNYAPEKDAYCTHVDLQNLEKGQVIDLHSQQEAFCAITDPAHLYGAKQRVKLKAKDSLKRTRDYKTNCWLCILMKINGIDAYILCDSGSSTDSLSIAFAQACRAAAFVSDNPISVQLGTTGPCSQIKYGTHIQCEYGPIKTVEYFDIYDIDKYDAIIGSVFMRAHNISINFEYDVVRVNGVPHKTLTLKANIPLQERILCD